MKIGILDPMAEDTALERALAAEYGVELVLPDRSPTPAAWQSGFANCDGLVTERILMSGETMDRFPNLKVIVRMGIGVDNVDLQAATDRGIRVFNVPDYCTEEVATHTLALLLNAMRGVSVSHARVRKGAWTYKAYSGMERISASSVGILGLGKTARRLIELLRPLGCEIRAWTRHPDKYGEFLQLHGVKAISERELLSTSDFVVVLLPLTPDTVHYINAERLSLMKPGAWLINTSRGKIVNESDLIAALQSGMLAGAALDVLDPEPPRPDNPLLHMENVVVTPHSAFYSRQSFEDLRTLSLWYAIEFLQGKSTRRPVNAEVERRPRAK